MGKIKDKSYSFFSLKAYLEIKINRVFSFLLQDRFLENLPQNITKTKWIWLPEFLSLSTFSQIVGHSLDERISLICNH